MFFVYFYVPESHVEKVKDALFQVGAGRVGHYDHCCWQVKGRGQFKGGEDSHPFIGEKGCVEMCEEYRVEMVFKDELKEAVVQALKQSHPYEEPAYGIIKLESS